MYRRLRNGVVVGSLLILVAAFVRVRYLGQPGLLERIVQPGPAEVKIEATAQVERGDIRVVVSATGMIEPNRRLPMFFGATGTVAEVLVDEGQDVHAGDVLARLETQDYEFAVRDAELAFQLQQIAYDGLTGEPRPEDLAAAEAAVNAAGAQVAAAAELPPDSGERMAALQLELARNQLWQTQLQRDQSALLQGLNLPVSIPGLVVAPAQAEASVSRSEYDVQIAEQQYAQAQNAEPNQANLAAARAGLLNAQANLDRLTSGADEVDLAIADAQLQMAYLGVALARYQLEQASLTAPFDGRVARLNLVVGEAPPTTNAAVELIDTSSYYIDLAVDEIDISQVAVGQTVEVLLDALPNQPVPGRVSRVDEVGLDLGGVVTYRVRVTLEQAAAAIRVGMSATATIVVDEVSDVLRIPNRFITLDRRTQRAFVTVQDADGTVEQIEVRLGKRNETYSEILAGVNEGDELVLLPRSFLSAFGVAP